MKEITYDEFMKVEIRVGKIIEVKDFPDARTPTYKLTIDFGEEIGMKKSSSRITDHYSKEELQGKLVLGVVNFPPKQIGRFMSEALTLGFYDKNDKVVLAHPEREVPLGAKLH